MLAGIWLPIDICDYQTMWRNGEACRRSGWPKYMITVFDVIAGAAAFEVVMQNGVKKVSEIIFNDICEEMERGKGLIDDKFLYLMRSVPEM